MTPTEAYAALARAMNDTTPPCTGDDRFILEPHELAPDEINHLGLTICRTCPLRPLCRAYADTARPPAGVWAGRTYPKRTKEEA